MLGERLCHQGKEFQEEVIRLCSIRDYRRKWIKPQAILQLQETKPTTTLKEMQAKTVITGLENSLLRFGRAGSLQLLAVGGLFLLRLHFSKYSIGSVLWLQVKD